jgi:methionyl-tRNA synthetase
MISFAEFKNVDMRIARVLSAEGHPNADKLLLLKVDLGSEGERQLVAGLKGHYTPEELVGRNVVVVFNLEPATLRGVESQGMVLACQDGDNVILLQPEKDAAPGSAVL